MIYETSIARERAISHYVEAHGPATYVRWVRDFAAFRNRLIDELETQRIPDEWLVRASLAASRAWESENPCPITGEDIERLRADAASVIAA